MGQAATAEPQRTNYEGTILEKLAQEEHQRGYHYKGSHEKSND